MPAASAIPGAARGVTAGIWRAPRSLPMGNGGAGRCRSRLDLGWQQLASIFHQQNPVQDGIPHSLPAGRDPAQAGAAPARVSAGLTPPVRATDTSGWGECVPMGLCHVPITLCHISPRSGTCPLGLRSSGSAKVTRGPRRHSSWHEGRRGTGEHRDPQPGQGAGDQGAAGTHGESPLRVPWVPGPQRCTRGSQTGGVAV